MSHSSFPRERSRLRSKCAEDSRSRTHSSPGPTTWPLRVSRAKIVRRLVVTVSGQCKVAPNTTINKSGILDRPKRSSVLRFSKKTEARSNSRLAGPVLSADDLDGRAFRIRRQGDGPLTMQFRPLARAQRRSRNLMVGASGMRHAHPSVAMVCDFDNARTQIFNTPCEHDIATHAINCSRRNFLDFAMRVLRHAGDRRITIVGGGGCGLHYFYNLVFSFHFRFLGTPSGAPITRPGHQPVPVGICRHLRGPFKRSSDRKAPNRPHQCRTPASLASGSRPRSQVCGGRSVPHLPNSAYRRAYVSAAPCAAATSCR